MARLIGKTVYLLGAGASHHTGAPLLKDFLLTARLLREDAGGLHFKESFERVFKWVDGLRSSSYYVEVDLDNLEHVFSLAEMKRQLDPEANSQLYTDLRYVVMETLDTLQLRYRRGQLEPCSDYGTFVSRLAQLHNSREKEVGSPNLPIERDAIVSFNYDVMLDYAMHFTGPHPDYCLDRAANTGRFRVLKLHGSTNFGACRDCADHVQALPPNPIPPGHSLDPGISDGDPVLFKMVTLVLRDAECNKCKKKGVLDPLIIPPTWSKTIQNSHLANIWRATVDEISKAFQLVVIGYSMPVTDTFFQYLLTLGLQANPGFHRVVVVNPDTSDGFRTRYMRVFSRSLYDRGRLRFIPPGDFRSFIDKHMEEVGTQTE